MVGEDPSRRQRSGQRFIRFLRDASVTEANVPDVIVHLLRPAKNLIGLQNKLGSPNLDPVG